MDLYDGNRDRWLIGIGKMWIIDWLIFGRNYGRIGDFGLINSCESMIDDWLIAVVCQD